MASREKTQADFDLEKMFEYIDEALTSKDERVQSALRGLLTIIELTRPQDDGRMAVETSYGPLRQIQEDLKNITRRLANVEGQLRQPGAGGHPLNPGAGNPYPMGPYNPGYPNTGTPAPANPPGAWWGIDPNMPHTTSKTSSSSSYTLTDNEKDSIMNNIKLTK